MEITWKLILRLFFIALDFDEISFTAHKSFWMMSIHQINLKSTSDCAD